MWAGAFALLALLPISLAQLVPENFQSEFRCPFARVWLEHGPEKAGELLGVTPHAAPGTDRRLQPWAAGAAPARCSIAFGAAGAAHQMSTSPGYSANCEGTPGQQSPYMWPLRWSAKVQDESMKFGSDEVTYESRGKVWYMLDRNWKRGDTWFRRGIQRSIGQSPCTNAVQNMSNACNRTDSYNSTVLHRQDKMVFIDWEEDGTTIKNCSWLNMSIVGNVRPDWFMDNRGGNTDVQYMGDSHVYWRGKPKLVKQWRKKDFASQYFTMSVQRLPGADGVNWPLILNVPGEGFGDDHLRQLWDHSLLGEDDTAPFLLDEEHVRNGGSCPERVRGGAAGGPPRNDNPVPSNLEVDTAAWVTRVWTGSPVWQPPTAEASGDFVQTVAEGVQVASCFDVDTSTLQLTLSISKNTPVWAAVGFRRGSECLMTPRGGGDGEIIYADPSEDDDSYSISFGPMSPGIRRFENEALAAFKGRLQPLSQVSAMASGAAGFSNGKVTLEFARRYDSRPSIFNLSFAYGWGKQLAHHQIQKCFTVSPISCPPVCTASARCAQDTPLQNGNTLLVSGSQSRSTAFGIWAAVLLFAAALSL